MTMIKKKTEVIPCIYERSFAYIYDQNQEFLSKLLSTILGIEYTSILGHITKISNNTKLEHKTDKKRQMDFVYRIDNLSIDIELNLRSKATKERNLEYLMKMHTSKVKKGENEYRKHQTYQINVNNEMVVKSEEVIDSYFLRNDKGKKYVSNFGVYVIHVPNIKKICYNQDKDVLRK